MPARRAAAEPNSLRHQVHNPDEVLVAVSFAIINDTVHCRSQVRHIKEASLCGAVRWVAVPSEQQVGFFVGGIGEVGAGQARHIYAAVGVGKFGQRRARRLCLGRGRRRCRRVGAGLVKRCRDVVAVDKDTGTKYAAYSTDHFRAGKEDRLCRRPRPVGVSIERAALYNVVLRLRPGNQTRGLPSHRRNRECQTPHDEFITLCGTICQKSGGRQLDTRPARPTRIEHRARMTERGVSWRRAWPQACCRPTSTEACGL